MKIILFVLSLIFIVNCYAEGIDKPRALIRKSDNKVVGIGYSNFEGNDKDKYDVVVLEKQEDIDKYTAELEKTKNEEKQKIEQEKIKVEQNKKSAKNKLETLGLNKDEVNAIIK